MILAGEDYEMSSRNFTFTQANQGSSQCLRVPVTDDEISEGSEVFIGMLSNTDSIHHLTLAPQQTNVTIIDDESELTV